MFAMTVFCWSTMTFSGKLYPDTAADPPLPKHFLTDCFPAPWSLYEH